MAVTMLFSIPSIQTMVHGVALGGGAIIAAVAAIFFLQFAGGTGGTLAADEQRSRAFAWLSIGVAALMWLAVLGGTFLVFPQYRLAPPEGTADLAMYPRAFLLSKPETAWLHSFAMEVKEHIPWVAAMLSTAAAYISVRYRAFILEAGPLRSVVTVLLSAALLLASAVGVLGIFVNKIAPVQ